MQELKTKECENNKKEDKRFENQIWAFVIIYAVVVGIGVIIESVQTGFRGKLLIDAAVGIATILMVGYIALQTKATREMVKQTQNQAELTRRTLDAPIMKKVIGTLKLMQVIIYENTTKIENGNYNLKQVEEVISPEYLMPDSPSRPSPESLADTYLAILKARNLLEKYKINLRTYDAEIKKLERVCAKIETHLMNVLEKKYKKSEENALDIMETVERMTNWLAIAKSARSDFNEQLESENFIIPEELKKFIMTHSKENEELRTLLQERKRIAQELIRISDDFYVKIDRALKEISKQILD